MSLKALIWWLFCVLFFSPVTSNNQWFSDQAVQPQRPHSLLQVQGLHQHQQSDQGHLQVRTFSQHCTTVTVCTTSLCLFVSCAVEMASISSVAQRTTLCTYGRPILTSLSSLLLGGTRMNITSASQVSKLYNYCTIGLLQYVAAVVVHFQWFSGSKLYQMCAFTSTKYVIIMMHAIIIQHTLCFPPIYIDVPPPPSHTQPILPRWHQQCLLQYQVSLWIRGSTKWVTW